MRHLQRIWCRKQEGAAAQAELFLMCENLLVHSSTGDAGKGLRFGASEIKPSQLQSWLIPAVGMIIQLAGTTGHKEKGSRRGTPVVLVFDTNCNESIASGTHLICSLSQDYHLEWHFLPLLDLIAVFPLFHTVFLFTKLAHQSFGVQSLAVKVQRCAAGSFADQSRQGLVASNAREEAVKHQESNRRIKSKTDVLTVNHQLKEEPQANIRIRFSS